MVLLALLLAGQSAAKLSMLGGLTVERTAESGKTYDGTLWIKNDGEEPIEAKIYQTDYLFFSDGSNLYGKPGQHKRSNAGWIELSHQFLAIPPRESSGLHYTVRVPKDPALVGTYWSIIMVEESSPLPVPKKGRKDQIQIGIRHVFRYAVQMVTHIGDTGARKVKILRKKLSREEGKKIYQIDIENTGQRWLRPQVWVELFDRKAVKVGRFEGVPMRIYPGTSIRQRIDLSGVPTGPYEALIVIDNGDESVFGARVKLKL